MFFVRYKHGSVYEINKNKLFLSSFESSVRVHEKMDDTCKTTTFIPLKIKLKLNFNILLCNDLHNPLYSSNSLRL